MDLRGRVISKFFAVWFVVMIVLPFTPPFQAWDPHSPVRKAPTHDVSDKLPKDAATAVLIARVVPVHESVSLHVRTPVDRQEKRQARIPFCASKSPSRDPFPFSRLITRRRLHSVRRVVSARRESHCRDAFVCTWWRSHGCGVELRERVL